MNFLFFKENFISNIKTFTWIKTLSFVLIIIAGVGLIAFFIVNCIIKNDHYNREKTLKHAKADKEELHNTLENVCKPYLNRLLQTSDTNLYHASLYNDLSPEYLNIVRTFEPAVDIAIEKFEENIKESLKEFKPIRKDLEDIMKVYKFKVEGMANSLTEHFKTEDGIRKELKIATKEYDDCREEFVRNEETLEILSDTFFRVFDLIEDEIEKVKSGLDNTDYEKAAESLGTIQECNKELKNGLDVLPELCNEINVTVPELIDSVEEEYEDMKAKNIPLHHLHVSASLEEYRRELSALVDQMKDFEYQEVAGHIQEMIKDLNDIKDSFKKEYDSAEVVEEDCMKVYDECNNIEKSFIALRQKLSFTVKVYLIAPTYDGFVDKIQVRINDLEGIKSQLDTYVHSSTKQPYSILFNKMKELESECADVNGMINELDTYIDSLKTDTDNAYKLINSVYLEVKHSEYLLRELGVDSIARPYDESVERIYTILNRLNDLVDTVPIDVTAVNRYARELVTTKTHFVQSVKQNVEEATNAENAIVIANRVRPSVNNYRVLLKSCEDDFFKGDFKKANEDANLVISKAKKA